MSPILSPAERITFWFVVTITIPKGYLRIIHRLMPIVANHFKRLLLQELFRLAQRSLFKDFEGHMTAFPGWGIRLPPHAPFDPAHLHKMELMAIGAFKSWIAVFKFVYFSFVIINNKEFFFQINGSFTLLLILFPDSKTVCIKHIIPQLSSKVPA